MKATEAAIVIVAILAGCATHILTADDAPSAERERAARRLVRAEQRIAALEDALRDPTPAARDAEGGDR